MNHLVFAILVCSISTFKTVRADTTISDYEQSANETGSQTAVPQADPQVAQTTKGEKENLNTTKADNGATSPQSLTTADRQKESVTTQSHEQGTLATSTPQSDGHPGWTLKNNKLTTVEGVNATKAPTTFTKEATTAGPGPKPSRSFDLLSFIGGLLLAVFVVLVALFIYCCCKSKKEKPYESLK